MKKKKRIERRAARKRARRRVLDIVSFDTKKGIVSTAIKHKEVAPANELSFAAISSGYVREMAATHTTVTELGFSLQQQQQLHVAGKERKEKKEVAGAIWFPCRFICVCHNIKIY